jgi:hypothetical protein
VHEETWAGFGAEGLVWRILERWYVWPSYEKGVALGQEAAKVRVKGLSGGRRDRGLAIDEGWKGGEWELRGRAWRG